MDGPARRLAGAEHYREIADKLREAASSCQFAGARKEILHLAARFESRAGGPAVADSATLHLSATTAGHNDGARHLCYD
jgi:hypothetical protein